MGRFTKSCVMPWPPQARPRPPRSRSRRRSFVTGGQPYRCYQQSTCIIRTCMRIHACLHHALCSHRLVFVCAQRSLCAPFCLGAALPLAAALRLVALRLDRSTLSLVFTFASIASTVARTRLSHHCFTYCSACADQQRCIHIAEHASRRAYARGSCSCSHHCHRCNFFGLRYDVTA